MRKIVKNEEPESLAKWRKANPAGSYDDIDSGVRHEIRMACLQEQFYLCAYCCKRITGENGDCMNEHVEARKLAPNRSLDYSNIVASCTTQGRCDSAHNSKPLPLSPLMGECETELRFKISGRVEGLTDRARESIRVLKLGETEKQNRALVQTRKQLADTLLMVNGVDPSDGLDDDDLIAAVIDDIQLPVHGKLEAFAPVVVNILRGWLAA